MTLNNYKALSDKEKLEEVEEKGVFLLERKVSRYAVRLLALDCFYVELWLDKERIVLFKSFTSDHMLDEYLEKIDISELFT